MREWFADFFWWLRWMAGRTVWPQRSFLCLSVSRCRKGSPTDGCCCCWWTLVASITAGGVGVGSRNRNAEERGSIIFSQHREKKKCVGGRRGEAGLVIKVLSDTARQQRLLGDPEHINHPSVCQPPSIIAASPALSSCWSSLHSCLFPSSLFLLAFLSARLLELQKKWCRALFTCSKLIVMLFSPVAAKGVNTKRQPDTQHVFILTLTWKLLQEKYCFTTAKPMQIYSMINTMFWSTSEFQGSWIKPDQSGSNHSGNQSLLQSLWIVIKRVQPNRLILTKSS